MGNEKERELNLQRVPEFREEYCARLERAIMRHSDLSAAFFHISWDETGELGVSIPSGLSDESRERFIEIVDKTYNELRDEFALDLYPVRHWQKDASVNGAALNSSSPATAPQFGERVLLLILRTKEERVNIPGDLEEEFKEIAAKHGARYAKLWYYKQVAASAWPLVRKAVGWGLLASVAEWVRGRI